MEEKIIIKGKFSKTNILMNFFGGLAILFAIIGFKELDEYTAYSGYNIYGRGEMYSLFLF